MRTRIVTKMVISITICCIKIFHINFRYAIPNIYHIFQTSHLRNYFLKTLRQFLFGSFDIIARSTHLPRVFVKLQDRRMIII